MNKKGKYMTVVSVILMVTGFNAVIAGFLHPDTYAFGVISWMVGMITGGVIDEVLT